MTTTISFERPHQFLDFKALARLLISVFDVMERDLELRGITEDYRLMLRFEFYKLFVALIGNPDDYIFLLYRCYSWMVKTIEYVKDFLANLILR
jgi:hypothetical protein